MAVAEVPFDQPRLQGLRPAVVAGRERKGVDQAGDGVRLTRGVPVDNYSFQHAVAFALAAGATTDEIVACLEAVTPVTGAAPVVQCAPKVALALGYDVDAALERHDS
jgi:hypothetical protein